MELVRNPELREVGQVESQRAYFQIWKYGSFLTKGNQRN